MRQKIKELMAEVFTARRLVPVLGLTLLAVVVLVSGTAMKSTAQDTGRMEMGEAGDIDEAKPAPGSIGTDISALYNGPAPSGVEKELVGPLQLLRSGEIDEEAGTITVPL